MSFARQELAAWLRERRSTELSKLWEMADHTRDENVGREVHLRGLIEFSNCCKRSCRYCGLRAANHVIDRYCMSTEEILDCVRRAVRFGFGTVVLQSGEDAGVSAEWIAGLISIIKTETPLAVTLSVGEYSEHDLDLWRRAGADRYLLRFETSNPLLYKKHHPSLPGRDSDRLSQLLVLRRLGYEIGSGIMVGLPGQTYQDLAGDIEMFQKLDLDMIGLGPYIPHPMTPLGADWGKFGASFEDQVPNTELMAYKVLALSRLVCPKANIPATTAIATLNPHTGYELGLSRGANVIMPNITPVKYKRLYEIYPGKACSFEDDDSECFGLRSRIFRMDKSIGKGQGDSLSYMLRRRMESAEGKRE